MARRRVPAELVAGGLGAVCCNRRWCYLGEHEVHGLARNPSAHGLPLVKVERAPYDGEVAIWCYECQVPDCDEEQYGEFVNSDAWARTLHAALAHLEEHHGAETADPPSELDHTRGSRP